MFRKTRNALRSSRIIAWQAVRRKLIDYRAGLEPTMNAYPRKR
jgi:hypothetical protein